MHCDVMLIFVTCTILPVLCFPNLAHLFAAHNEVFCEVLHYGMSGHTCELIFSVHVQ